MIKLFRKEEIGKADFGWLKARYHFSFANYYNKDKVRLGSLRVLNDDLIGPHTGFDTHQHNDMEIISYVIDGELTHQDSMGNKRTLKRGNVQYMSAGTGVYHSEHNLGDETVRGLQIWIYPYSKGLKPNYGDKAFTFEQRHNKLFNIVSGENGNAAIKIYQDAEIYVGEYTEDIKEEVALGGFDYVYFIQIEGETLINGQQLNLGDALMSDENLTLDIKKGSHFLFLKVNEL